MYESKNTALLVVGIIFVTVFSPANILAKGIIAVCRWGHFKNARYMVYFYDGGVNKKYYMLS